MSRVDEGTERILVAIEPDGKSAATVDYVGRIAAGNENFHLCLYSRKPGLPPDLLEHGGSGNPDREKVLGNLLSEEVQAWCAQQQAKALPLLEGAQHDLVSAGVSEDAVEFETSCDELIGESLAEALRRVARANDCRTIAIGKLHSSDLQELVHHHAAEAIVRARTGLTLWIVG